MKTTLTPQESAELISKGISADKASEKTLAYKEYVKGCLVECQPASQIFTLADLLSLLPNNYPGDELDSGGKRVYLTIAAVDWNRWMAKYSTVNKVIAARIHDEMIDSVYELLLWAIDHNHVKLD